MCKIAASTNQEFNIIEEADRIIEEVVSKMTSENEAEVNPEIVRRLRNLAIRNFMFITEQELERIAQGMQYEEEFMGGMKFEEEWDKVQRAIRLRSSVKIAKDERDPEIKRNAIFSITRIANSLNLDIRPIIEEPEEASVEVFGDTLDIPMLAAVA